MARHNIQFRGMRHAPSDISSKDGDLLECVNLVHEDGELKPVEMPEKTSVTSGSANGVLMAVHHVTAGDMFVYATYVGSVPKTTVTVKTDGNVSKLSHDIAGEEVKWVDTVGNTLVIGTDLSTHYALFKNGEYVWLGDKVPQPVFKFDFKRKDKNTDMSDNAYTGYYISEYDPNMYAETHSGDTLAGGGIPVVSTAGGIADLPFFDSDYPTESAESCTKGLTLANGTIENKKIFRDCVRSRVVSALHKANMGNVFVFPFFIRYAVRMYDGNYVMHSAPILMIPSTETEPLLALMRLDSFGSGNNPYTDSGGSAYAKAFDSVAFRGMEMVMRCFGFKDVDGNAVPNLSDWGDIVKGVDVFLSSQVRSYDERAWDELDAVPTAYYCFDKTISDGQGGYVTDDTMKDFGHCYTQNNKVSWWDIFEKGVGNTNPQGVLNSKEQIQLPSFYGSGEVYKYYKIPLPQVSKEAMEEKIKETNLFYRVKQYDFSEVSSAWSSWHGFRSEVEAGTLDRLETLPTLPDDFVSRCRMAVGVDYAYNQRLVLGDVTMQAPSWYQDVKTFSTNAYVTNAILFYIEKPEKTIYVSWTGAGAGLSDFGHYLFYPDPDCTAAIIGNGSTVRRIPMVRHNGLHGAYALMTGLKSLDEVFTDFTEVTGTLPSPSTGKDRYYSMSNTIAMSDVANPFHFTASNFKDVGRAEVLGIAANVQDVSSAQWGQYPMYVFCSDGIVAVGIDNEGKMGAVRAVSADVLLRPQSSTQPTLIQTNQSLVFLTQRGVMGLGGTKVSPLSTVMNGRHFNAKTDLRPLSPTPSAQYGAYAFSSLVDKTSDATDFRTFLSTGYLAYDYAHDRVLLLNASKDYQYVLSIGTGLWSKQLPYTNGGSVQANPASPSTFTLSVSHMQAAVNNYTEMYLQDATGAVYRTMAVTQENNATLYQYGYMVSRPVRFGTDEYKTLTRMLNRYTHYAANSFVKVAVWGSRDGVRFGKINTLRGMSYKYFVFGVYTYLKPNERYSYLTVDFEQRLTNKLR